MTKTIKVRWNGAKEDPDSITQYGVTFNKGEWTDVPHDDAEYKLAKEAGRYHRTIKFEGNPFFEVKGRESVPAERIGEPPPGPSRPVRAPGTTYQVQGNKKDGWVVVDDKGNVIEEDKGAYKTAEDAQTVADALNAPKP